MSLSPSLTYYHAGALFTIQELAGNALLAQAIRQQSEGRYRAILPQDLAIHPQTKSAIRDADLLALLEADLALFHFDGTELDSGTVVEFMVAKFADIPAVLLRTDFRRAGDSQAEPWNLMLSDYPRCRPVILQALELYHQQRHPERGLAEAADRATEETARQVIAAFTEVQVLPPRLTAELREPIYRWLAHFPAFGLPAHEVEATLQALLQKKVAKGLL